MSDIVNGNPLTPRGAVSGPHGAAGSRRRSRGGCSQQFANERPLGMIGRCRWIIGSGVIALTVGYGVLLVVTDAPSYRLMVHFYTDRRFLNQALSEMGLLAPVMFMALQAIQVIVAPIPGGMTGLLGGFLFGEWPGFLYSTIGLGLGSVTAFRLGRWLGPPIIRKLITEDTWQKMGFIVEAEGAVLCFVIFLLPGFPKDVVCYLLGMSPMSLWVFVVVSTLGRIPDTWLLSAQGAHAASGEYVQLFLLTGAAVVVVLPLYRCRSRIIDWFQNKNAASGGRQD